MIYQQFIAVYHYIMSRVGDVSNLNWYKIIYSLHSIACVSADLAVVVSPVSTRGISRNFIDQRCAPNDVGSLRIPHGVICYNGTSVGSVASYVCDDGYQVSATNNQQTCLVNGNWEGDILICIEPQPGLLFTYTQSQSIQSLCACISH